MSQVLDRRLNKNRSAANRQRFIKRYKNQIKKAVSDAITKRSIRDIEQGEKVNISKKDISEPIFQHGQGGIRDIICPGNKEFSKGDRIQRPPQGQGQGGGENASNEGEGEDEFVFELSREEFLDIYFEDLALPDLVRKEIAQVSDFQYRRAGFTTSGVPTNINVIRSMKQATGRRIALSSPLKKKLRRLEEELEQLEGKKPKDTKEIERVQHDIEVCKRRMGALPFIDDIDIRYNNKIKVPVPSTQAVMFCIMDVSGSMDESKKDIAKRFFILLYLFLTRNYEKIEIVFVRHHTTAKEVDEEEFFYSRETGGTVVSSALEMVSDIIQDRFPTNAWNIYCAQASDGDNWNADSPHCQKILAESILPSVQYFAYTEIMPRHHQSLWESYSGLLERYPNFAMQTIQNLNDIYPVFRELFKKEMVWHIKQFPKTPNGPSI